MKMWTGAIQMIVTLKTKGKSNQFQFNFKQEKKATNIVGAFWGKLEKSDWDHEGSIYHLKNYLFIFCIFHLPQMILVVCVF